MAQQQDALMNLMTRGTKKVPTPWEQRMAPVDDTQILPGVGRDPISDTNRALYQDDKEAYNRKIYPRQMEAEDRARLGYGSAQEEMEDRYSKELELRTAPLHIQGQYDIESARAQGDALGQRLQSQQDYGVQQQNQRIQATDARSQAGIAGRAQGQVRSDALKRAQLVESGKTPIDMGGWGDKLGRFLGMSPSEEQLRTNEANRIRSEGFQDSETTPESMAQEIRADYPDASPEELRSIAQKELEAGGTTPEEMQQILMILSGG